MRDLRGMLAVSRKTFALENYNFMDVPPRHYDLLPIQLCDAPQSIIIFLVKVVVKLRILDVVEDVTELLSDIV